MPASPHYALACDFGSSGGKIYLGCLQAGHMTVEEVHRFPCQPVRLGELYYTDALYLYQEMLKGVRKTVEKGITPNSMAINTWGVDVVYLSASGELLANPVNYRSERTQHTAEKLAALGLDAQTLYSRTGLAPMPYNTLFQVYEDTVSRQDILSQAKSMLWLPDLFAYWLTGVISTEPCIASTSQMMEAQSEKWDKDIIAKLPYEGIADMLPPVQAAGSVKGMLRADLAEQLNCAPFPVIAASSHDTACAVLAAPLQDANSAYISSGSWSLFGQLRDTPITTEAALAAGFANERGYGNTVRFLKSINGLWTLQQLQRQWAMSFDDMENAARAAMGRGFIVDVSDPAFYSSSDMEAAIIAHCQSNDLPVPSTRGEITAAVYEGLGQAHAIAVAELREITGEAVSSLHLLGGGCRDSLFCETIKRHVGLPMTLGPIDATAAGNLLSQWIGQGQLASIEEARACVTRSFSIKSI